MGDKLVTVTTCCVFHLYENLERQVKALKVGPSDCLELRMGGRENEKRTLRDNRNILYLDCVGNSTVYICQTSSNCMFKMGELYTNYFAIKLILKLSQRICHLKNTSIFIVFLPSKDEVSILVASGLYGV